MTYAAAEVQILVLQSTTFCNIACSYCYLPDRQRKEVMSRQVLEKVGKEIIGSKYWRPNSLLLWHAGEPLICGTQWYEEAHAMLGAQQQSQLRVQFQTNGTLIDENWVRFLGHSKALVGLSIDGPREHHDKHRRDRRERPTFDLTMRGVKYLRAAGLPFSTISVVTNDMLDAADAVYDFFQDLRPELVGFSLEEAEGENLTSSLYSRNQVGRVEDFFYHIARRNFLSNQPLRIREVEAVIKPLLRQSGGTSTSQEVRMGWIVAVGAAGDVALFSPELLTTRQPNGKTLVVGNILRNGLDEIFSGELALRQQTEILQGVALCEKSCRYFKHCGGGSPANKFFETHRFDIDETWYCRLAKQAVTRGILHAISDTRFVAE